MRPGLTTQRDTVRGVKALAKLARRRINAFEMFRATIKQTWILLSVATELLIRGGNRSGKSVTAAVMFAAIALDKEVISIDGRRIRARQPHQTGRPLTMWCVGLQKNHIGQTLFRLLFQAGLFDMVRDQRTGMWRAWNPTEHPEDAHVPMQERKPSPPLIPPSQIESISWSGRSRFEFDIVTLKNGTQIFAYASSAPVKRGDPVDIIWIDEEIKFSSHYPEWQARLSDRKGRIIWSSWPASDIQALRDITRRAKEQREQVLSGARQTCDVQEFVLTFSENPFIDDEEKRKRIEGWSEAERVARDRGEYTLSFIRTYPEYNPGFHCVDYGDNHPLNDELTDELRRNNWVPGSDWTRDVILDPGTKRPGVLFCAIPPKRLWQAPDTPYYVVYKELFEPRLHAELVAQRIFAMEMGFAINRFIIDDRGGRQQPMSFDRTVRQNYTDAFMKIGLRSMQTGSGFIKGNDDWMARSLKLRAAMYSRSEGHPQLRIINHLCPHLVRQLQDNVRDVKNDEAQEKPAQYQIQDLMDCLEYWISCDPAWVKPPPVQKPKLPSEVAFDTQEAWATNLSRVSVNGQRSSRSSVSVGLPVSIGV